MVNPLIQSGLTVKFALPNLIGEVQELRCFEEVQPIVGSYGVLHEDIQNSNDDSCDHDNQRLAEEHTEAHKYIREVAI